MPDDPETIDLEELVGNVLDSRGLTKERLESFDGLSGKIDQLLTGGKNPVDPPAVGNAPAFDEAGFLDKINALIDEKVGAASAPKEPPLRRWLKSA